MARRASVLRSLLALLSIIFLCGSIVLLFLLLLAGAFDKHPLNRIFFLQADTNNIPNAPQGITHWTLYNHCDANSNGININCRPNKAAYPLDPQDNFQTQQNIPRDFLDRRNTYFYLSRFTFAFYLIDLFFACCALVTGLAAMCTGAGAVLSALLTAATLFFTTFTACIMTACYVMAQKAFRREGRFARVGVKAFAFTWTTVALLFLATLGFLAARHYHGKARYGSSGSRHRRSIMRGVGVGGRNGGNNGDYNEKGYSFRGMSGARDSGSYDTTESQKNFTRDYDYNHQEPTRTVFSGAGTTT